MKLALEEGHTPEDQPKAFRSLLARAGHARTFAELRNRLADAQRRAHQAYLDIVRA